MTDAAASPGTRHPSLIGKTVVHDWQVGTGNTTPMYTYTLDAANLPRLPRKSQDWPLLKNLTHR